MEPTTMMGIGALLSGAGSLGSLFGGSGKSALRAQENMNAQNIQMQKEFAQEGIRWRVADAKAAGIHPLYALGAQIPSYSPSTYIPGERGPSRGERFGSALDGLGRAGQGLARALDAGRTDDERHAARMQVLTERRAELENDLISSQIARLNQQPTAGVPSLRPQAIPGQADVERNGLLVTPSRVHAVERPQEVTRTAPGIPSQEPHEISDLGFARTATGLVPVPSKDMKERIEDMSLPEALWSMRNNLLPPESNAPSHRLLPPGAVKWRWNFWKGEWQPEYEGGRTRDEVTRDGRYERVFDFGGITIDRERR